MSSVRCWFGWALFETMRALTVKGVIFKKVVCDFYRKLEGMIFAVAEATEEEGQMLTAFFLVLGGAGRCVGVSSDSETMRVEMFWWLQRIDIRSNIILQCDQNICIVFVLLID